MLRLRQIPGGPVFESGPKDESITIGRAESATLTIEDPHISGLHAQVVLRDGRWCFQDLGSTNGSAIERQGTLTPLTGADLAPITLAAGDRIVLGSGTDPVELEVLLSEAAASPVAATVLAETQVAPAGELAHRLANSGRPLTAWLDLADGLAKAGSQTDAFEAFGHWATTGLQASAITAIVDQADEVHWWAAGAEAKSLPKLSTSASTSHVCVLEVAGLDTVALVAPVPVATGQILFAVGCAPNQPAASTDEDGLALAASLLTQRLRQLKLVDDLTMARAQLAAKNRYLREKADRRSSGRLIGDSPAMQTLHKNIAAVALSDATVLISGPSGSGKELVAREVHRRSLRHAELFAAVNCGALAEGLLESELFGHRKGAFTGAHRDREGLFEVAHSGSLFLDEIGEMSASLQVKLLRVLETGEVTAVGDTRVRRLDVRVICATHRDLTQEVAAGRFREDLFYRLHVFPIQVPALADRVTDIPALVKHFVRVLAGECGLAVPTISPEALAGLVQLPWPGNVRQLMNWVQRALLLSSEQGRIEAEHLGSVVPLAGPSQASAQTGSLKEQLATVERKLVSDCLARHAGNRTRSAAELGITRQALLAKLKKLDLHRPPKKTPLEKENP